MPASRERAGERRPLELRVRARARDGADVGERHDPRGREQPHELLERAGRVADGEDARPPPPGRGRGGRDRRCPPPLGLPCSATPRAPPPARRVPPLGRLTSRAALADNPTQCSSANRRPGSAGRAARSSPLSAVGAAAEEDYRARRDSPRARAGAPRSTPRSPPGPRRAASPPADGVILSELSGKRLGLGDLCESLETAGIVPDEVRAAIGRLVEAGIVEPRSPPRALSGSSRAGTARRARPGPAVASTGSPERCAPSVDVAPDALRSPCRRFSASRRSFEPRVGPRRAPRLRPARERHEPLAEPRQGRAAVLRLAAALRRGDDRAGRRGARAARRSRSCCGAGRPARSP